MAVNDLAMRLLTLRNNQKVQRSRCESDAKYDQALPMGVVATQVDEYLTCVAVFRMTFSLCPTQATINSYVREL